LLRHGISADIIFAQDPLGVGLPALCAAKILGKKFVVKIVGDRAWEEYMNQESGIKNYEYDLLDKFQEKKYNFGVELRRSIQKFVARRADSVIVPSEYLKNVIVNGWGISLEQVEVIYNAFELQKINITRDEARAKLLLSGEIIVSIGRLVPWKGFETLIELFPDIVKRNPKAKLYIIGGGPERKNLESRIKNQESKNSIFLTGNISHEEAVSYLIAADVFVLNTGYEGLSHTILEAMSVGVPIITTRVGGNLELIEDGISGRLVEYQDKKAITEAIVEVFTNVDMARQRFGKSAREKAAEFSKEKMFDALTCFFKQLRP
jgi:glycosyltransferase involved in cell wall biosynthesis